MEMMGYVDRKVGGSIRMSNDFGAATRRGGGKRQAHRVDWGRSGTERYCRLSPKGKGQGVVIGEDCPVVTDRKGAWREVFWQPLYTCIPDDRCPVIHDDEDDEK